MSEDLQMLSFRSSSELIQEGLELTRWAASFYDPNFYGFYLLGVLAFCLALYQTNRVNRTALLVLMGLNVVSLFMTLSRTATVGLLVLLAFSGYYLAGIKKLVLISLPVLLGLFVVVSLLTDPLWQERAMQRLSLSPEASGTSLGDSFGRQQYFDAALEAFGSSKMVGVGSTGLSRISGVAYGSGHNVYLTWLARYGLVGFCLSMPFLLYPFRALRIGRKSPLAMYAFVALGLTTATMVTYMAYDYFDLLEPQYIAFAVIYAIIDRTLGSPSSKRSFVRPSAAPRTEVPVAVRVQAPEALAESWPKAAQ
jgi:O-antigen ligase